MTYSDAPLIYRRDGNVARIQFNRPSALNAIDIAVAKRFLGACSEIAEDRSIRVVVLSGAGRAFAAGGDLKLFRDSPERVLSELLDPMHEGVAKLAHMQAPVIASLHGAVSGAGLSLAMACDLAIAAEGTRFNLAYANVGTSCDVSASWTLPRLVGLRKALEIALLNETLDAAEALRLGLVNWVVPATDLEKQTEAIVARLASGPPVALGNLKRLMRDSFARGLVEQLAAERQSFLDCMATADFNEAVRAFFEKRPATYQGH